MEGGEEDYWRWFDGMGGLLEVVGWRGWGLLEVVEWRVEKKIIGGGLMEGGDYWRLLGGGLFEVVGWRGEKRIIGGGWVWGGGLRRRI